MTYPYTGTTTSNSNGSNRTSIGISPQILIKNDLGNPIGAIKSLRISERGTVTQIQELGTDGIIDSCRTKSVEISGSCNRVRFAKARITEAFGRNYVHLAAQAYPFDIWIYDRRDASPQNWVYTVIKNVWMESLSYNYDSDNWIITDDMNWKAETIYSTLGTSATPSGTGGDLGYNLSNQVIFNDATTGNLSVEQATDIGLSGRRGSLDIPGFVDAIAINGSTLGA